MRLSGLLVGLGLTLSTTGCMTQAFGSAPGPDSSTIYVVGRRDNPGVIWSCPAAPNGQQCSVVNVETTKN